MKVRLLYIDAKKNTNLAKSVTIHPERWWWENNGTVFYPTTLITEDELHNSCREFMELVMNITETSFDEIPLDKFNTAELIERREFYMNLFSYL